MKYRLVVKLKFTKVTSAAFVKANAAGGGGPDFCIAA